MDAIVYIFLRKPVRNTVRNIVRKKLRCEFIAHVHRVVCCHGNSISERIGDNNGRQVSMEIPNPDTFAVYNENFENLENDMGL